MDRQAGVAGVGAENVTTWGIHKKDGSDVVSLPSQIDQVWCSLARLSDRPVGRPHSFIPRRVRKLRLRLGKPSYAYILLLTVWLRPCEPARESVARQQPSIRP